MEEEVVMEDDIQSPPQNEERAIVLFKPPPPPPLLHQPNLFVDRSLISGLRSKPSSLNSFSLPLQVYVKRLLLVRRVC